MEVTPLDLRGLRVPLGEGATPHGRDVSLQKEEQTKTNTSADFVKHEYPMDTALEHLAATLQRVAPRMDQQTAQRLAKLLLRRDQMPETDKALDPIVRDSDDASHIDKLA